jgi:heme-degrading monooxygenase HmoA
VIARIWHGSTKHEHADAYETMLKPELLPGVGNVTGYKGSYLLRKNGTDEVEFITIMFWDSIDAIRDFVGPDYETSVIPEERRKYLCRHDTKAEHYEVASIHGLGIVEQAPSTLR